MVCCLCHAYSGWIILSSAVLPGALSHHVSTAGIRIRDYGCWWWEMRQVGGKEVCLSWERVDGQTFPQDRSESTGWQTNPSERGLREL